MGKTHSKPLAARHGRGTAWTRHAMCESALTVTLAPSWETHNGTIPPNSVEQLPYPNGFLEEHFFEGIFFRNFPFLIGAKNASPLHKNSAQLGEIYY